MTKLHHLTHGLPATLIFALRCSDGTALRLCARLQDTKTSVLLMRVGLHELGAAEMNDNENFDKLFEQTMAALERWKASMADFEKATRDMVADVKDMLK